MEKWGLVLGAWFVVLGWKTRKRLRGFTVHGSRLGEGGRERSEVRDQRSARKNQAPSTLSYVSNFEFLSFEICFEFRASNFEFFSPSASSLSSHPMPSVLCYPMPYALCFSPPPLCPQPTKNQAQRTKNQEQRSTSYFQLFLKNFFRPKPSSPGRPVPKRSQVVGSGIGCVCDWDVRPTLSNTNPFPLVLVAEPDTLNKIESTATSGVSEKFGVFR